MLSNIFSKCLLGLSGILLARVLTKTDFGFLKTTITFTGLCGIFVNFGLNDFFLFEFSKEKNDKLLRKTLQNYLALYLIFFPLALVFYVFLYSKGVIFFFAFYIKSFFDWVVDIIKRYFQSYNLFNIVSLLTIISTLLISFPAIYIYIVKQSLNLYIFLLIISSFLLFLISLYIYFSISKNLNILSLPKLDLKILKKSYPFFLSSLMSYIYMQSDILMLSFMKGTMEVSRYAVVSTLIFYAYLFPSLIYNYFLPMLVDFFSRKQKKYILSTVKKFIFLIFLFILPIVLTLFIFSTDILKILYKYKYIDSSNILKLLSIVFFFHSFCFVFGAILTASGNQILRSKLQFFAAILNIILNILFIPKYGAEGAASATAITEIFIFLFYFYTSIKILLKNY